MKNVKQKPKHTPVSSRRRRMKTAKAKICMFDLECPHCGGLLMSPEGNGSLTWSIHESAPSVAICADCSVKSKVPRRVAGADIHVDKAFWGE